MKRSMVLLFGIGIFLLLSATFSLAQFYELSYPGNGFFGYQEDADYRHEHEGSVHCPDMNWWLSCKVNFPASANGMNVSRLSVTYYDNFVGGYVRVRLYKVDRWTGTSTIVADLESSNTGASPSIQYMNMPQNQMTAPGINNNRYAWFLYYWQDETGSNLKLHYVTIRYQ